jgi:hypothetical protein
MSFAQKRFFAKFQFWYFILKHLFIDFGLILLLYFLFHFLNLHSLSLDFLLFNFLNFKLKSIILRAMNCFLFFSFHILLNDFGTILKNTKYQQFL